MPVVEGPYQNLVGVQFPLGWEIIREHNWPGDGAQDYVEIFPAAPILFTSFFSPTHRFEFITDPKCFGSSVGHHYVYMRRVLPPTPTGWQVSVSSRGVGHLRATGVDDKPVASGPDCRLWLNGEPRDRTDVFKKSIFQRIIGRPERPGEEGQATACTVVESEIGGSFGDGLRDEADIPPEGGNLDLLVSTTFAWNYQNTVDTQVTSGWPSLDILENPDARYQGGDPLVNYLGARPGVFVELDIRIRRKPGKTVTP